MICSNCGKEISEEYLTCPWCGTEQGDGEKTVGIFDNGAVMSVPAMSSSAAKAAPPAAGSAPAAMTAGVGFGEAIKRFFARYVGFSGRACRSEFWFATLFSSLVTTVILILTAFIPYFAILLLGLILPSLAVSSRRMHDIGKSGWYQCISLIPFAGPVLFIIAAAKPGEGPNRFGPVPDAPVQEVPAVETPEERIYRMTQEHEPRNLSTPQAKQQLDEALNRIIPTYTGAEDLCSAVLQCNLQDIKANTSAMDMDTLLVINKAIRQHKMLGADMKVLGSVEAFVNEELLNKIR